jgi:hypothetical protein
VSHGQEKQEEGYWHFLASFLTKLSSLAWCQKYVVGNYKNTCKLWENNIEVKYPQAHI